MNNMVHSNNLPDELLENIGKRLNTKTNVSRFRAVCRSWWSSIPPFQNQLLLPNRISIKINPTFSSAGDDTFTVSESVVYHLQPPLPPATSTCNSRGWVIKVRPGEFGETLLLHPLSPFQLQQPPKSFPKLLNLLHFRVFELTKALHLFTKTNYVVCDCKVAMSLDQDYPAFFVARGRLSHCKLGVQTDTATKTCTLIDDRISQFCYADVICHQGKLCAVASDGRAVVAHQSSLELTTIASPTDDGRNHKKDFVESLGDLLLVDRQTHCYFSELDTFQFKVFKLNAVEKQWVEMEDLSDRILFVGEDCCFSASAQDFPGSQGNCIYFFYLKFEYGEKQTLSEIGVFNLADCSFVPLGSAKLGLNLTDAKLNGQSKV